MIVAVLLSLPVERLPRLLWVALAASSGRSALRHVCVPEGIREHQLSARARRLVRQAQVSAW